VLPKSEKQKCFKNAKNILNAIFKDCDLPLQKLGFLGDWI